MKFIRQCFFCGFEADYDSWPDGSIVSNGLAACALCLESPKIRETMELARNAEWIEFEQEALRA